MAALCGEAGRVVGIEYVGELVPWSEENLRRDGKGTWLDAARVTLIHGDGSKGAPERGPFAAIHVPPRSRSQFPLHLVRRCTTLKLRAVPN